MIFKELQYFLINESTYKMYYLYILILFILYKHHSFKFSPQNKKSDIRKCRCRRIIKKLHRKTKIYLLYLSIRILIDR